MAASTIRLSYVKPIYELAHAVKCSRGRVCAGDERAVLGVSAQLVKVAFQCQRHAKTVFARQHHVVMNTAKAFLVGLYAHVGLHHGRAENEVKFVVLQLVVKGAEGAAAGTIGGACLKCLVYGSRIYLLHIFDFLAKNVEKYSLV